MKLKKHSSKNTSVESLSVKHSSKNLILLICNLVLVLAMVLMASIYSRTVLTQKNTMKRDAFCTTVESMKQVSENYFSTEKGYVDDWAAYITNQHMTAEQALAFISATNTHEDRTAHLVDLTDMSAHSTVLRNGTSWVHCYEDMVTLNTQDTLNFIEKMKMIFYAKQDEVLILGKYRVGEMQQTVVSVGAKVTIREADGTDKDYLLLRLIPVDYLQRSWVFPTEFPAAEIGLINRDGAYIVQAPSLRSKSFPEFIRGYNFQDNYNKVDELSDLLLSTQSGLLTYNNSSGESCYFYYSSLGQDSNVLILGYIPVSEIQSNVTDWSIVFIICGTLLLLGILDGCHVLSINRKLRQAVAMANKANMAKTQFLSSMSHDIRTPMNAVIGMTEIAKLHLDDPAYVKECLNKVSASGNHLLTLINDILDISKIESGKITLNPCAFMLREMIEEMCEMIRQGANDKNIAFTLQIHDIVFNTVIGDPLRIRQILINLLTNAIKYTKPGGHIVFDVGQKQAENNGQGERQVELQFVVSDDGIGISQEFQKNMYSSFARATDSRINTIQGSGLGLAIAKQMVEMMHGTISCVSAIEEGTTFTVHITVPAAEMIPQVENTPQQTGDSQPQKFSGMRVLVAEDNDLNWQIIEALLHEYNVSADRVENGQLCLERLHNPNAPHYALVLMDVQMPVMNGREATRQIRCSVNPYVRNIPVAAMTADAFAEDIYACLQSGMDDHLAKPLNINQLLEILKKVKAGTLHKIKDEI